MCTTLVDIFSPCQLVVAHTRCTLLPREDAPRSSLACTPNLSTTTHLLLFSWPFSLCRTPPVFHLLLFSWPYLSFPRPPPLLKSFQLLLFSWPLSLSPTPLVFPSFTLLLALIFVPDSPSLSIFPSSPGPFFSPDHLAILSFTLLLTVSFSPTPVAFL